MCGATVEFFHVEINCRMPILQRCSLVGEVAEAWWFHHTFAHRHTHFLATDVTQRLEVLASCVNLVSNVCSFFHVQLQCELQFHYILLLRRRPRTPRFGGTQQKRQPGWILILHCRIFFILQSEMLQSTAFLMLHVHLWTSPSRRVLFCCFALQKSI